MHRHVHRFELSDGNRPQDREYQSLLNDIQQNKDIAEKLHTKVHGQATLDLEVNEFLNMLLDAYTFVTDNQ